MLDRRGLLAALALVPFVPSLVRAGGGAIAEGAPASPAGPSFYFFDGRLYALRPGQRPWLFATLRDVAVEFRADMRELFGAYQFGAPVVPSRIDIGVRARLAEVHRPPPSLTLAAVLRSPHASGTTQLRLFRCRAPALNRLRGKAIVEDLTFDAIPNDSGQIGALSIGS